MGLASVLLGKGIYPDGVTASSESDASRSRGILLRGRGTNVRLLGPSGSVNTSASVDESSLLDIVSSSAFTSDVDCERCLPSLGG